jgi:uncharacterized protein
MKSDRWCDFNKLRQIVSSQFVCDNFSIHGRTHWERVERNGIWIARRSNADDLVVRLFAWFHDSKRINNDTDDGHGKRGAEYVLSMRGKLFDLEDGALDLLVYACTWHTDQKRSNDPTIGTCWDADRLDLGRVGEIPNAYYMSTDFGKKVAEAGSFYTFLKDDERA